jgi:mRNA-degrading endonuclease YafQ of YafQ-DinJ toxin-antitoxin module
MIITATKQFYRNFTIRILPNPKLTEKFKQRVLLFAKVPQHPTLKLHKLAGNRNNYYSLSITGDIRVILTIENDIATFHNVGTHSQVY